MLLEPPRRTGHGGPSLEDDRLELVDGPCLRGRLIGGFLGWGKEIGTTPGVQGQRPHHLHTHHIVPLGSAHEGSMFSTYDGDRKLRHRLTR
jgi:hypothetical protein